MPNEPMITIKQADGTFTQVPLSEVQQRMPATPVADDATIPIVDPPADVPTETPPSINTPLDPLGEESESISSTDAPADDIAVLAEIARAQVTAEAEEAVLTVADTRAEESETSVNGASEVPRATPPQSVSDEDTDESSSAFSIQRSPEDIDVEIEASEYASDAVVEFQEYSADTSSIQTPNAELRIQDTEQSLATITPNTHIFEHADEDTDVNMEQGEERDASEHPSDATVSSLRIQDTEQSLATITPNTHIFEHADPHAWDEDDHQSLLDHPLTPEDVDVPHETRRPGMATAVTLAQAAAAKLPPQPAPQEPVAVRPKRSVPHDFAVSDTTVPYVPLAPKVPMQDISSVATAPVTAPTAAPMGPVAELEQITLDDFRRLGGRNTLGIGELRQKFELLLKESILLYMEGVQAWHRSPLYATYLSVITESVQSGTPIDTLLESGSHDITKEEWHALIGLHREIRL